MTTSLSASPPPSASKAEHCLQSARAAKAAGNAALKANDLRGASFQYKKVYLFVAEYLPHDVAGPSTLASSTSRDESNNGLVQLLQQRRPRSPVKAPLLSSAPPPDMPAAAQQQQQQAEQAKEMIALYATSLNNLALVHLKLGRYREGVACASAILDDSKLRAALDTTHNSADPSKKAAARPPQPPTSDTPAGRALLRRASCYVKLAEWAAAEADVATLMRAHAAAGTAPDAACVQLTESIRHGRKAETETEKKMMQRMFS
ncbi:hypothetical protein ABB37_08379 [Leptomonas pyrrhocoris]|uniref:Uncharacterized protein n=1 Tax=Leptomonas pyrrhocoris TaxID=157538 RepID=A0A0M9FT64_LEPPY|nr:hypothetical protein ABB37_08379 [Leptomonas pyrrhocoris]XP_015653906.1 hypothetical protein ABB37_08379 [Leptomonas pyrrhocoris]KPA75466.1 hypothetical protein ABB37_08379 [Leptomonas pyrrhocoris]KPA75467.1 hypothetical protein ABB37_08379 [Leptomonas pyrrhocoris]|eukprot:XP_015653905.1 hypothetical protein ABB37_08379 [Leptomonas pyrrhocoris]